uniref:Uncharacterized protein n=1 Tax=Candidatus Kentrum sp. LFY TaxID=2126342 RepID=A0A450UYJ0_9GAMM|nr:MAG: hypothetical protein BECKLFY1418A_GA0070994_107113 [Candidatus Kentron sp. LFY]
MFATVTIEFMVALAKQPKMAGLFMPGPGIRRAFQRGLRHIRRASVRQKQFGVWKGAHPEYHIRKNTGRLAALAALVAFVLSAADGAVPISMDTPVEETQAEQDQRGKHGGQRGERLGGVGFGGFEAEGFGEERNQGHGDGGGGNPQGELHQEQPHQSHQGSEPPKGEAFAGVAFPPPPHEKGAYGEKGDDEKRHG